MDLLPLKLLFINLYLVTSFEHRFLTNWERMVKKVIEAGGDSVKVEAEEKWIEQPLDHDNENEKRTWKMRYFEDLSMWQSGGPVILLIGGESEAEPARFGLLYELATETNAAVFFSEHRYYGESIPFGDITTSNLKYLSSKQALHDNVNLLKFIKSDARFATSKVVALGGSYSGNLAAWIRLLFPELIDAAISSSAPVLAKKDFFEYFEVVGRDLNNYGSSHCYESVSNTFMNLKQNFTTENGIEWIKKKYNVCPEVDFTKKENVMRFFLGRMLHIFFNVQFAADSTAIQDICSQFQSLNETYNCHDYEINHVIDYYKTTRTYDRMWLYQTCTEFGYFQTGNSQNQPFTEVVSVDYYLALCEGVFGPEFNEQRVDISVANTNKMYGGLSPKLDKVVFVNGDMDPWSALGIKESLSSDAPAVVIQGVSHCSDYRNQPVDADGRRKWDQIKQFVKSWIGL